MSTNQWCFYHKFTDQNGRLWECVISTKRWNNCLFKGHSPSMLDLGRLHKEFELYVYAAYPCDDHDDIDKPTARPKDEDVLNDIMKGDVFESVWYFDT